MRAGRDVHLQPTPPTLHPTPPVVAAGRTRHRRRLRVSLRVAAICSVLLHGAALVTVWQILLPRAQNPASNLARTEWHVTALIDVGHRMRWPPDGPVASLDGVVEDRPENADERITKDALGDRNEDPTRPPDNDDDELRGCVDRNVFDANRVLPFDVPLDMHWWRGANTSIGSSGNLGAGLGWAGSGGEQYQRTRGGARYPHDDVRSRAIAWLTAAHGDACATWSPDSFGAMLEASGRAKGAAGNADGSDDRGDPALRSRITALATLAIWAPLFWDRSTTAGRVATACEFVPLPIDPAGADAVTLAIDSWRQTQHDREAVLIECASLRNTDPQRLLWTAWSAWQAHDVRLPDAQLEALLADACAFADDAGDKPLADAILLIVLWLQRDAMRSGEIRQIASRVCSPHAWPRNAHAPPHSAWALVATVMALFDAPDRVGLVNYPLAARIVATQRRDTDNPADRTAGSWDSIGFAGGRVESTAALALALHLLQRNR